MILIPEIEIVTEADSGLLIRVLNAAVLQGGSVTSVRVDRTDDGYRMELLLETLPPERASSLVKRLESQFGISAVRLAWRSPPVLTATVPTIGDKLPLD